MDTITKQNKKTVLAPKLRFKGFEAEKINSSSISDLLNEDKKLTYGIVQPGEFDPNGIIMIRSQDYSTGWNDISTFYKVSLEIDIPYQRSRVTKDDIIITVVGGNVGKLAIVPDYLDNANISRSVARISINKNKANSKYVNFFLEKKIKKLIFLNQVGGAQPVLNLKELSLFNIPCPSLPEQEKIAAFLTAVDKKIQQLNRKKQLLEQYKKGVMQQLFSGKLRFKDENGKAYPKWEEKKLGDVLDYIQPTKYLVESTEYDDSYDIPVVTAGKTFILGYTNEKENIFKDNLPVIIFDDFTTATQFVDFPFKAKSSAMKILVPKENENIGYIYSAMQLIKFEVGGHGRHWISQYSLIDIPYPCLNEQKKIADFLSAIDVKINGVAKALEATTQFKKGLLQQMFV